MTKNDFPPPSPGIPLNELDKLFYAWELLGSRPISRILFEFKGGHIDIALLRQAYAIEIRRRPILNAVIAEHPSDSGWDVRWMPRDCANPYLAVRLCDFSGSAAGTAEEKIREIQFDPFMSYSSRTAPPFSLVLCTQPHGGHKLVAFVHHAVTGAHGLGLILGDLFTAYNQLAAGHTPDASACGGLSLATSPLLPGVRSRRLIKLLGTLAFFTGQFFKARGKIPAKIYHGGTTFTGSAFAVQHEVSAERLSRYLLAAKRASVTLNVFLVAAQIAAIDTWRRERGESGGLISIDVHKSLRSADGDFQQLANKFSTFQIYARPCHRADIKTLLLHVGREHEKTQKSGAAEKMLGLLWLLDSRLGTRKLKLWGNFIFNNPRMGDSSQVTNVGRVWAGPDGAPLITRLGDAEITGCYMAAMPNPSIGNYSSFVTFNNRLYISFNYFDWSMSDAEARRFVDLFEKALEGLADSV